MIPTKLALRPDSQEVLARCTATSEAIASIVDVLPLQTQEDRAFAGKLVRETARLLSEADTARKAEKAPHLQAGRDVDSAFKRATEALAKLDRVLRARIQQALEDDRARELAATTAARVAVLTGDVQAASTALAQIPEEAPALDGISARWAWTYEVQDLTKVPEAFTVRVMNDAAVQGEIERAKAEGRVPHVPGLAFRQTAAVSVRKGGS